MELKELTEEQRAKVRAANTPEEILALAKEEGYELSDEELEAVAGGGDDFWKLAECPKCGNRSSITDVTEPNGAIFHVCGICGHKW